MGDELRLRVVPEHPLAELAESADGLLAALEAQPSLGWTATLTVIGEAAGPADVARDEASSPARLIIPEDVAARAWRVPSGAFWRGGHELLITVTAGTDPATVARDLEALPGDGEVVATGAVRSERVSTATRPYMQALTAFAVLVAMVGLVVAGGAVARQAAADARIDRGLRVNGADRRLLTTMTLGRAAIIGVGAAVLAVVVAVRASPWLVLGPSSAVEPTPRDVDLVVLAIGVVATVAGLAFVSLLASWRTSVGAVRPSSPIARTGASGLPLMPRLGFELAFPRSGPSVFLMRSALLATLVALATATAVAVVGGSLRDLVTHPERHGGGWDVALTCEEGYCEITDEGVAEFDKLLRRRPDVAAWSFVTFGELDEHDRSTPAVGVSQGANGPSPFTIVAGREPATADEVVLGTSTLRHLDADVGDRLQPDAGGPLEVVGAAAFTGLGPADDERASLGTGAGLTIEGLRRHGGPKVAANAVLVTGADVGADELASRLRAAVGEATVISRDAPGPIAAWRNLRSLPVLLAALLVLMAMASLAHAVVLSARSRRHDLAVWRALGLRRRECGSVMAWQSAFIIGSALLVGVPLGLLAGAAAWDTMRRALGVPSPTTVLAPHVVVTVAALTVALMVLVWALRLRDRSGLTDALRTE